MLRFLYIDINKEGSGQLVESCIEEMSTTLNELYGRIELYVVIEKALGTLKNGRGRKNDDSQRDDCQEDKNDMRNQDGGRCSSSNSLQGGRRFKGPYTPYNTD